MDGNLGGTARLSAVYAVARNGNPGRPHTVNYTASAGDTYADYATVVGRMIDRMSDAIARDIANAAD